jgi:putative heme iron utilization protein
VDLNPGQFLTDIADADALLEAEQGAIDHMNADHLDAINLYATKLLGAAPADWRCTGCDPDGMDLQAGSATLRLDFPRRIVTPAALRQILKELADQARAAASI